MPSMTTNGRNCTSPFPELCPGWAIATTGERNIMSAIDLYGRENEGAQVLSLERFECSEPNSVPNLPHSVKVKVQAVVRVQNGRAHFAGHEQVSQIRPG